MPLYLVEGLNCSGKTTYIRNKLNDGFCIDTCFANPLRWDDPKRNLLHNDSYFTGVYESIIKMFPNISKNFQKTIYWDRTFISAYVYDSIRQTTFDFLVECLRQFNDVKLVFMDTPYTICYNRLCALRTNDPYYKEYVKKDSLEHFQTIWYRFLNVLDHIRGANIKVELIDYKKGYL